MIFTLLLPFSVFIQAERYGTHFVNNSFETRIINYIMYICNLIIKNKND